MQEASGTYSRERWKPLVYLSMHMDPDGLNQIYTVALRANTSEDVNLHRFSILASQCFELLKKENRRDSTGPSLRWSWAWWMSTEKSIPQRGCMRTRTIADTCRISYKRMNSEVSQLFRNQHQEKRADYNSHIIAKRSEPNVAFIVDLLYSGRTACSNEPFGCCIKIWFDATHNLQLSISKLFNKFILISLLTDPIRSLLWKAV